MQKEVRLQAFRMLFILGLFLGLALWQLDFVIRSVEANVYLNVTIISTFVFGCFLAFRSVMSLRNEMVALTALQVQYKDRGTLPEGCYDRPARVFSPPQLLGHAYRMISDELTKPQALVLPPSTVKMLVEGVDVRIDDRKSTLTYISGLLVFLGLIGTFVGLMQTVGSVGDIIGSLNFGGDSGESIDTAFQGLIADLQGPLVGMATGFSSSLFGLLCSLSLGLLERFGTAAHRILPLEFESWLSNIARLENNAKDEQLANATDPALRRLARLEARMTTTAQSAEKSAQAVSEILLSIHAMSEKLSRNEAQSGLAALSDLAREMAHTQRAFMEQLDLIRELGATEQEQSRDITSSIVNGFHALQSDRQAQDEVLTELRLAIQRLSVMRATAPQVDTAPTFAEPSLNQAKEMRGPLTALRTQFAVRSANRKEKALRQEYHGMMREVLDKAFRRDSSIANELDALQEGGVRQESALQTLVEHNRALQAQQKALAGQVEYLAKLLATEREDETLLEEVRRGRLGLEMAMRQITAQISETRDAAVTQKVLSDLIDEDDDMREAS
ncbi:MAG: hypothetical protein AAF562_14520 [Pseudomonadota bacterium]